VSFRKPAVLLVAAVTLFASILVPVTNAQQEQNGGSGLQVSPTRSEITAQPGEQKNFSVVVKNITNTDVTAQTFLNDFQSDNSSGTPQIIVDNKERTPYSLSKMLTDLQNFDLKAGETKEVKFSLNVPSNASPGAYFGALRFASVPKGANQSEAQRQVSLTASVAHLVFVEVAGEITEQIQIEKLQAQRNNKGSSFFFSKPNTAAITVKNKGNGFSRPFGDVILNGVTGSQVHSYKVNDVDPRGIILPSSTRVFSNDIKGVNLPGRYTLVASVAYGNGGEVVTYKSSFWYVPVWFIVLLLALIAAVVFLGYRFYKKRYGAVTKPTRRRK
jgi:hypothetical protein